MTAPEGFKKFLNRNLEPSLFSDAELYRKTGLRETQFCERVAFFAPAKCNSKLLSLESQVLLYYTKKRQNHTFDELAVEFNCSATSLSTVFWTFAHFHNQHLLALPQFNLAQNCTKLDKSLFQIKDPFILGILGDEFLGGRMAIGSVTDRSYLYIEKSSNIFHQKRSFCAYKSSNVLKVDLVTNLSGRILLINPWSKQW